MVDCGFSYKDVIARLERLDLEPDALAAILVTHEHSDHVSGVEALSTRHAILFMHHAAHGLRSMLKV